ncbi:MAG: hypothetical protein Sapg2KO_43690 [Saprospiraceae bacterium]
MRSAFTTIKKTPNVININPNIGLIEQEQPFTQIPKILHQTWKDKTVPSVYLAFQKSWQKHLPDWKYRLWTDEENRAFIAKHYNWFLTIYDAYPQAIMRVDAVRYFWMYHFGGLYVDLDFEALKSVEPLLDKQEIVIGLEPGKHLKKELVQQKGLKHILCNAFLASIPKAPFWTFVILQLIKHHKNTSPLEATGPFFLTQCYDLFKNKTSISLVPASLLYPIDEDTGFKNLTEKSNSMVVTHQEAYVIHHWSGTWWRAKVSKKAIAQKQLYFLNFFAALDLPSNVHPIAQNIWYRVLQNGIVYKQAELNLEKEASRFLNQSKELPLVSCLLVTKNRFQQAKKAIHCFLAQSYPNRELIIIDDGLDTQLRNWVEELKEDQVHFFHLPAEGKKLGVLRNLSREYAQGAYIAQWDDDDFSHSNRLLFQMIMIVKFNLDGCTLQREQLWFPKKQKLAYSNRRLWEGAMVCSNEKLPAYHERKRGEETDAVTHLALNGTIALLDFPELYTYCFHGSNTFDEPHFEQIWQMASFHFPDNEYQNKIRSLEKHLNNNRISTS